jgi:ribonuclease BN (tRNA processing enzyme)
MWGEKQSMKIRLLGTNGWYDSPEGNTPCVLVQTSQYDIIFDAGYGFAKADQFIRGDKPAYLFLSHFHYDHLIGLHTLAKCRFDYGLRLFGLPGVQQVMKEFFNPTFTIPLNKLSFPVTFEELNGNLHDLPFAIQALPLIHSGPCQGYRLEAEGHTITYCTDTGYCENAVTLARGSDLLMTECTLAPGSDANPHWPHLNPTLAASIAKQAQTKRLILVHFDAAGGTDLRNAAEQEARSIFPATTAGYDGMVIDL